MTTPNPLASATLAELIQWSTNAYALLAEAQRDAATVERRSVAERRIASHRAGLREYQTEIRRRERLSRVPTRGGIW